MGVNKDLTPDPGHLYWLSMALGTGSLVAWYAWQAAVLSVLLAGLMLPAFVYGKTLSRRQRMVLLDGEYDRLLLQFARQYQGVVSIPHLVSECPLTLDEAEHHLERLTVRGYARQELHGENGTLTYIFPEFQNDLLPTSPRPAPEINQLMTVIQRNRLVAGILAVSLGSFGVHKFYLGKNVQGIFFVLFFWSGIPALIGLIEGIIYLTQSNAEFAHRQGIKALSSPQGYYLPK